MAFKLVVFACLVALVRGSGIAVAGPAGGQLVAAPVAARITEYDPSPSYRYGYRVDDTLTGDYKTQEEVREGELVRGQYSFIEADGTRRVVEYNAGPAGFEAYVRNEALVTEPVARVSPQPVVAQRLIAQAPVASYASVAEPVVAAPAPAVYAAAPARYAAAPAVYAAAPARYAAAPAVYAAAPARYAAAPAFYAAAPARYAAPVAEYAAAGPFVGARYAAGPVPAAYRAAYPAPVAAAYATPAVASAFGYTTYSGPGAYATSPVAARFLAAPAVYGGPAPAYSEPVARAAPAKIVAQAPAEGYRYP